MSTGWDDASTGEKKRIPALVSLIVSAFTPVADIRLDLTNPGITPKITFELSASGSDSLFSTLNFSVHAL